jgi:hypothetical protein
VPLLNSLGNSLVEQKLPVLPMSRSGEGGCTSFSPLDVDQ